MQSFYQMEIFAGTANWMQLIWRMLVVGFAMTCGICEDESLADLNECATARKKTKNCLFSLVLWGSFGLKEEQNGIPRVDFQSGFYICFIFFLCSLFFCVLVGYYRKSAKYVIIMRFRVRALHKKWLKLTYTFRWNNCFWSCISYLFASDHPFYFSWWIWWSCWALQRHNVADSGLGCATYSHMCWCNCK